MNLQAEDLPMLRNVDQTDIESAFSQAFGKFIILLGEDGGFIQAADVWAPDSGASDPFTLEYRDCVSSKQYATTEPVTLEQVRLAFLDYFRGGDLWRQSHTWEELSL